MTRQQKRQWVRGLKKFCFQIFVLVPILIVSGGTIGAIIGVMMGAK